MCIQATTTARGIKITFDTANMPITSGMKALISGKKEETLTSEAKAVKKPVRISITSGEQTPQGFKSLESFSVHPVSQAEDYNLSARKYWNAKARKPRGKKQKGAVTIRDMYLN